MWDDPLLPDLQIQDTYKDTRLYHPNGGRIYRENPPIGFGRIPERKYIIKD